MILVIDSGNTYTKIGQFIDGKLVKVHQMGLDQDISPVIRQSGVRQIVLGSVKLKVETIERAAEGIPIFNITTSTPVPYTIRYKTIGTLGIDRLAGISYAWSKFPERNLLVIDAGTCITYDFINAGGEYLGGSIAPGLDIRFKSLNMFTANLPLVEFDPDIQMIGENTQNSILSGVIYGTIAEIEGMIQRYRDIYDDLTIFMSGGSAIFFESKIKHSIFAIPNMVLWGLYSIYEYNFKEGTI